MAEKPFRVLLDLTDLHIQSFKYVWISVSPSELKTIADFKQSLFQKINLGSENVQLFVRNGLLLDEETVIVLREDDTVIVQYERDFSTVQEASKDSTKSISCRKRNLSECYEEDIFLGQKSDSVPFAAQNEAHENGGHKAKKKHKKSHKSSKEESVLPNDHPESGVSRKHKKKNKEPSSSITLNSVDSASYENYVPFSSIHMYTNDPHHNRSENFKNVKQDRNRKAEAASSATFETDIKGSLTNELKLNKVDVESSNYDKLNISNSNTGSTNCSKKKRKRRKKRNKTDFINNNLSNVIADNKLVSNEIQFDHTERKHVIYTSDSPVKVSVASETINLSSNNNCDDAHSTCSMYTEGTSRTDQKNHSLAYPKVSTPAQSNGFVNPNWQVSLMQNGDLDTSCDDVQSMKKQNVKNNKHDKDIAEQNVKKTSDQNLPYSELPPLNAIPVIGAHIVYKVLELNENYSPEVSEYREGIVKSIDPETDEMEIEFLRHEIKPGRTGKFENLQIDEVPPPEIKRRDIVCWSSLIEPKLISR